jgi:hypothetical protein
MLTWDKKYLIAKINQNDYNQLIEKAKNKSTNQEYIDKIENMEKEYQQQLENIELLSNDETKLNELLKLSSFKLIQEETKLVKLISKYSLQQSKYQVKFLLKILNLLYKLSEELRRRLKQPEIIHKPKADKLIVRCSYKFCVYKHNCDYHYKRRKCNSDHFVHNMVSADIKVLINYFNDKTEEQFLSNKEVIKSINTILFVISHMEDELGDSCRYQSPENWEKFHI